MEDLARIAAIIFFSLLLSGSIMGFILPFIFPKSKWKLWLIVFLLFIISFVLVKNYIFIVFFGITFIPVLLATYWWRNEYR